METESDEAKYQQYAKLGKAGCGRLPAWVDKRPTAVQRTGPLALIERCCHYTRGSTRIRIPYFGRRVSSAFFSTT